jgi:hypothetical protein
MTSLLVLATLYLFAALVLVLIIDRSVGIMFPASADDARRGASAAFGRLELIAVLPVKSELFPW